MAWAEPYATPALPSGPQYNHILIDDPTMDSLLETEMPSEEYYRALAKDMRSRHPKADKFLLEHLGALEPLFDMGIVSGFSFGVDKAKLCKMQLEWLGEGIGREKRRMLDHHRQAIL